MPILFRCPGCDAKLRVADGLANRKTKCPGCGAITTVPGSRASLPEKVEEVPAREEQFTTGDDVVVRPPRHDEDDEGIGRRRLREEPGRAEPPRRRRPPPKTPRRGLLIGLVIIGSVAMFCLAGCGVTSWLIWRASPWSAPMGLLFDDANLTEENLKKIQAGSGMPLADRPGGLPAG